MQDYEESVAFLGNWGPFQRRNLFLLCLSVVPSGYNLLCVIFLLATPSHHCHIPTNSNLSQEWIQASIPVQVPGKPERSSCSRYDLGLVQNLSAFGTSLELVHNQSVLNSSPEVHLSSLNEEGCKDGWSYSTEYFQSTVVSEFNLVCDDQWKQPLSSFIYFLGGLSGCWISGPISDRFGRKPVLFGANAMLSIFSCAVAFAPSWPVFTVLFFMMGMGQIASYVTVFVLGSEILTGRTRLFFSNLCLPFFYVFSMIALAATAYLVTNWRHLSLTLAVPGLACIPLWWFIPESPRWLISRGRLHEAELLLRSAAVVNRVEAPRVILSASVEKPANQKEDSLGLLDLLSSTNVRNITLMLWLIWFSLNVSYFGMQFNMSSLSGNPFLNYILVTAVELPGYMASWLATCCLPRRLSYICLTLLGALALLLIQITLNLKSHPAVTLSLVMLGKFGILAGLSVLYTFTGELFPTVIRSTALSTCATFSRVGFSVSPYLLQLVVVSDFLPWIIVGVLSLLTIVLCILLPETFRQPMPDTIQQMAHMKRFRCPWTSTPLPKDDEKSAKDNNVTKIICATHL